MDLKIHCDTGVEMSLSQMTLLQGDLKKRTENDYDTLRESLKTVGLISPFYIWRYGELNYILDGHARHHVLSRILDYTVPVVFIEADDIDDAKSKLLEASSRYGHITPRGLREFVSTANHVVVPKQLVKVHKAKSKPAKSAPTYAVIKLQLPVDRVAMFLETIRQVNYITIIGGSKG